MRNATAIVALLVVGLVALGGTGPAAAADPYPTRAITLIVPFPAGGGADITGRLVAEYLAKKWGHPISVVNVAGGGAVPGVKQALDAKPDGYTMMVDVHVTASMMPAVYRELPFDWKKRTPIARVTVEPVFYLVNQNAPFKTLADVAKAAKENPKKLSWGGTGPAGLSTFVLGQFFDQVGVPVRETNMVSLGGSAPALTSLAGAHIDLAAGQPSESFSLMSAKKIRALAVVSERRLRDFPAVPTVAEAGYPGLNVYGWQGLSGPAGLPPAVVDKWSSTLAQAVKDPEFIALAERARKDIAYLGPEEFKALSLREYERFRDLATKMNIQR